MHILIIAMMHFIIRIIVIPHIVVMAHVDAYSFYCYNAYCCAYYRCYAYYCYDAC